MISSIATAFARWLVPPSYACPTMHHLQLPAFVPLPPPSAAPLPWHERRHPLTNASSIMRAIYDSTRETLCQGTVEAPLYATSRNAIAAKFICEGENIFSAMADLITQAQYEILVQTYVWDNESDAAHTLLAALSQLEKTRRDSQAQTPVRVRILVRSGVFFDSHPNAADKLEAAFAQLDARYVQADVACDWRVGAGSLHSKTLIVDGQIAVISGANIQKHFDKAESWFDTAIQIEGQVAAALRSDFAHAWRGAWQGWQAPSELPAPPPTTGRLKTKEWQRSLPILVTTRQPTDFLTSSRIDNPQNQAFLTAFAHAQKVIRIITPNLNAGPVLDAICTALRRGVKVQIILSKGLNDSRQELPGQGGSNHQVVERLYADLSQSPAARQLLDIRWFSRDGKVPIEGSSLGQSHAKGAMIDDRILIMGSANHDNQSWFHSRELNIVVDSFSVSKAWHRQVFKPCFERSIQA